MKNVVVLKSINGALDRVDNTYVYFTNADGENCKIPVTVDLLKKMVVELQNSHREYLTKNQNNQKSWRVTKNHELYMALTIQAQASLINLLSK